MGIHIEVDGERFLAEEAVQPGGNRGYNLTWTNGPDDGTYGFTVARVLVGTQAASRTEMTPDELEEEVGRFVRSFFATDGIGPADFPDFVATRRAST